MAENIILLSHGAGGKLTAELVDKTFLPRYGNETLLRLGDGAVLEELGQGVPVLSTDSYVVNPYFFPGGDIGSLAVYGTVNDLAMCGGRPLALTVAMILEEGIPVADLERICESIGRASERAGVKVVTGDTKVVERGHGDGIYINTSGLAVRSPDCPLDPKRVRPGDRIIVDGPMGQHGAAILGARRDLPLQVEIPSDSRPLVQEVQALLALGDGVKILHDPTRGGLATCLNEIARQSETRIILDETLLPEDPVVTQVCELVGLDPLYLANEGKLVAVVAHDAAEAAVEALLKAGAPSPAVCGEVLPGEPLVVGRSAAGGERILDVLTGDPLPRIC